MKILSDLKAKSDAENKQNASYPGDESRQSVISTESGGGTFEPGIYEDIESEVYDETVDCHDDDRLGHGSYLGESHPRERPLPQRPDGLTSSSPKTNQWSEYSYLL